MSVTFYVGHEQTWPDGQPGLGYEEGDPSLLVANENCAALLRLLQPPCECTGTVLTEGIPAVRRRIVALLNSPGDRAQEARPPSEERGVRVVSDADGLRRIEPTPRVLFGGIGDEYLCRKLRELDAVLAFAQRAGLGVYWT